MLERACHVAAFSLLAALLGVLAPTAARAEPGGDPSKVKALIIGVPKYGDLDAREQLPRAKADAEALRSLLIDKLKVPSANIQSITDKATREAIRKAWKAHLDSLKANDISIFFFSGHGQDRDKEQNLLPADFSKRHQAGIALPRLVEGLEAKSRNVVGIFIIDACRNVVGGNRIEDSGWASGGAASTEPDDSFAPLRAAEGTFVFYAASTNQMALHDLGPGDTSTLSVYSRVLLKLFEQPEKGLHEIAKEARWETYLSALERKGSDGRSSPHLQVPAFFDDVLQRRSLLGSVARQERLAIASNVKSGPVIAGGGKGLEWACASCPEMVRIPAASEPVNVRGGSQTAGVELEKPYLIGKYEVTRDEWRACQEARKCRVVDADIVEGDRRPITGVTWDDTKGFFEWLEEISGQKGYRLPTEAEWEHAARGGSPSDYGPAGEVRDLCDFANGADASLKTLVWANPRCNDGKARGTTTAGSYRPNGYGAHDMQGNVWEWVNACYDEACSSRIAKGGSWRSGPEALKIGAFQAFAPGVPRATLGFRVARDLD